MDTLTTEASEDSTISSSFADHVESSSLTDRVDHSTISSSLTDHVEHSAIASSIADHSHKDLVVELPNHGDVENKHEIAEDDVRSVLETIAATGKFCCGEYCGTSHVLRKMSCYHDPFGRKAWNCEFALTDAWFCKSLC